ncbi:unknown protein [Seminavis robusta]|uniref:Uncharacterized protein n=1 Tax=Seminavis robusta TaxID=568900 RepID=A0A9N8HQU3_9STRA|nr:unknown protein [Seminavis robusta]|eukprot:Sro1016_g231660.1 n/a (175) ;mRNA; f:37524-38048
MSSDSIATGISTSSGGSTGSAAAATNTSSPNNAKLKMSPPFDSLLFADDLILVQGILPYVGVGQYAFVGAVNKKMNQLYKEYCTLELKKNPRKVKTNPGGFRSAHSRSSGSTGTFCSETFCNQPRAEYWLKDNSRNKTPHRDHVCTAIAKIGNLCCHEMGTTKRIPHGNQCDVC